MDEEEADALVEKYYNDPGIVQFMKQHELDWEFAFFREGEIDAIRRESLLYGAEQRAKAAVRPGFRKMLKYWL